MKKRNKKFNPNKRIQQLHAQANKLHTLEMTFCVDEVPQKIHRGGSGHATVFGTGAISLDEQKLIDQWCKDQENHEVFNQSGAILTPFKVGDDVVLKFGKQTEIMTVCSLGVFFCAVAFDGGFCSGYVFSTLRRATPKEIKAGRRLP